MAWGVGTGQTTGHLRAKNRIHGNPQAASQGRHIETGEMKHLLNRGGLHQRLEARSLGLAQPNAHAGHMVLRITDLHQTEAIASMDQPHGFGVDSQRFGLTKTLSPGCIEIPIEHSKRAGRCSDISHGGRTEQTTTVPL